jgi:mevalonate kinase
VLALLGRLVDLARDEGLPEPAPGRLVISTDIPVGSGFGSSGALCAGLVNLFWGDRPLAHRDRLAWKAESLFHGTPSGIDTALALRQGWWKLDASTHPATATPLPDPGLIVVAGAVVREADTRSLVGSLARRKAEGDPLVSMALDRLGAIAVQAASALTNAEPHTLPPLVNQAREGLRSLGLETPNLESVLDASLRCPGALAGKLSGAGGGGAFFVVFRDRRSAIDALAPIESSLSSVRWTVRPRLVEGTELE